MSGSSWIEIPDGSDFPIENLPYGAFRRDGATHLGVAIGDRILDLHVACESGLFEGVCAREMLQAGSLNPLLAAGKDVWRALRARLHALLRKDGDPALRELDASRLFADQSAAEMLVPVQIGDYVDFYSSEQHATNLGRIFRPNAEPLLPNWKWMPIGYHGRAGSIVVDGTPIRRPRGQRKPPDSDAPIFAPSAMLDIELEIGFFTGSNREIFGLVLLNDWSARDIQAWEYQPLGPFLGKSFGTTISPWVVTFEALAPFRVSPLPQNPPPLPHLRVENDTAYDIALAVDIQTEAMRAAGAPPLTISRTNARELYWSMAQQLAHATSNGAAARPGDLFASGTISGSDPASYGSLIEMTWRGTKPLALPGGENRAFLEDGDEIALRGWCERPGLRIGFGACRGRIVAAD
jgi:fumarylacetoacetase